MKPNRKSMLKRCLLPFTLFFIHAVAVLVFASVTGSDLAGPNSDGGSLIWVWWIFIDFPLGIIPIAMADWCSSNILAVTCLIVLGGLQWFLYGLLIQGLRTLARERQSPDQP